ncbi:spore-associated protein [Streptomyces sp. NPDC060011]|uniref:spore-associated protein n=1 Tax=unclassified Streptomyces TaxID=2593676 RepID=UPI0013BDFAFE|nr:MULTISPECIES: spore-associated protein [unclassified Streptomyces]MCX4912713.1 spore-associated protein [Streptomyces sp. NBC_00687]MCX5137189.1 spore-associated protein [Streptomyces sp. NBC_00340]MCX5286071.1 spore-associated protein [Streptomyces sp. NBC_00198]NEB32616.1 spore-associated protein [Streptomyces sp. SID14446]WSD81428.1 spore-associated protein [Streptomyces sp. NBC_01558]
MRFNRSVLVAGASAALLMGASTALAAPASAAPNTTPQKVCGSAYKTVNSAAIGSQGTVYLTYNASNGKNCVTTIRNSPGTAVDMSAWVYVSDTGVGDDDYGQFTSYAGPTYVYGKGHCIDWGGQIKNVYTQISGSNCGAFKEQRVTFTR